MPLIDVIRAPGGSAWHDKNGKGAIDIYTAAFTDRASTVQARQARGIPQKGKRHDDDPNLRVVGNEAKRIEEGDTFEVTVRYETGDASIGGSDAIHPLRRPIIETIGRASILLPVDYAMAGPNTRRSRRILKAAGVSVNEVESYYRGGSLSKIRRVNCPITNTAGSVPDPKPMIELRVPVLTITRNVKSYDKATLLPLWNTLNRSPFRGHKKNTVMLASIVGQPKEEEVKGKSFEYVTLIHDLLVHPWGWEWRLKNEGRVAWNEEFKEWFVLRDEKTGMPFGEPRLLDRKGNIAEPGAAPIWLYFDLWEEASWANLKIG